MGNNIDQAITAAASSSISVINQTTQQCLTTLNQNQLINVCAGAQCGDGACINIGNVDFSQFSTINVQCGGCINITSNIQQQISQQMQQAATEIAQKFPLGVNDTNQFVNVSATLGASITNEIVVQCIESAWQTQQVNIGCDEPPGSNGFCYVNIYDLTFQQNEQAIVDCVLNNDIVNGVVQNIQQTVKQKGKSEIQSIFGPLGSLILIVLIIIFAVFYQGEKALTDYRLWLVVIFAVLIYLVVAFSQAWFPFLNKSS